MMTILSPFLCNGNVVIDGRNALLVISDMDTWTNTFPMSLNALSFQVKKYITWFHIPFYSICRTNFVPHSFL